MARTYKRAAWMLGLYATTVMIVARYAQPYRTLEEYTPTEVCYQAALGAPPLCVRER